MVWEKIFCLVKDEWFNFNNLTVVLKLVMNYEALGLKESYHEIALDMHFLKHANMQLLMKKFAMAQNMFPLNLLRKICKSA